MKIRFLLQALCLLFTSCFFFACSSARYYDFGSPGTAYHAPKKAAKDKTELKQAQVTMAAEASEALHADEPVLEASAGAATSVAVPVAVTLTKPAAPVAAAPAVATTAASVTEAPQIIPVETPEVKPFQKREKRGLFGMKAPKVVSTLLLVILAIFLPPLAVFLKRGISGAFWLNILLTLLFILPGIIHALIVVLT